jgi:hypothetical protein
MRCSPSSAPLSRSPNRRPKPHFGFFDLSFTAHWSWALSLPAIDHYMDNGKRAATYTRDPSTRGNNAAYEQKFANLIKLCEEAKKEGVQNLLVTWPWVLGDTYDEMIESLSRIADAGLALQIVERNPPDKAHLPKLSRN